MSWPNLLRSGILVAVLALLAVNVHAAVPTQELAAVSQQPTTVKVKLAKDEMTKTKQELAAVSKQATTDGDGFRGNSSWSFSAEALALRRDGMDFVPLVVDTGSGATLLNANDLDLDYRRGLKFSASRDIGFLGDLELEYFRVNQLGTSENIAVPNAEMTVYGATFGTNPIGMEYNTDLKSLEANWRYAWWDGRIKTLIGYRKMELGEDMKVTDAASPPRLFKGDLNNKMHGWQLGIEGIIFQRGRWEIEGGVKYGKYHNTAKFDAAFPQAGPAAIFHAQQNGTASAREVWLGVNYSVTDNLSVRLGYQAMRIGGVALLPEQLDDLKVPILGELDMDGNPLYQGVNLGLQFNW